LSLYKNKILSFVLFAAVLFVLNGSEFFHNHSAGNSEDNCPACIINYTLSNSDLNQTEVFNVYFNFKYLSFIEKTAKPDLQPTQKISNRAPPTII